MKTREIILVLIIIGYLLANLSFLAFQNSIEFEKNKDRPMQMIKLDMINNTTITTSYELENPNSNASTSTVVFQAIMGSAMKMGFALPFAIAGIGLVGVPIGLFQNNFVIHPEGYRVMGLWLIAMSTIPINYLFTKDIPLFRRIPYIYLLAAIISGTPMLLNSDFGR